MKEITTQLVLVFMGSLGVDILFRLRRSLWIPASLGSMLCWCTYFFVFKVTNQIVLSCLCATVLASIYGEILAIIKRAPTTLFMIPSVLPLIPGSSLYYTMSAAIHKNTDQVSHYGRLTIQYALSIAAGISIVWTIFSIFRRYIHRERRNP